MPFYGGSKQTHAATLETLNSIFFAHKADFVQTSRDKGTCPVSSRCAQLRTRNPLAGDAILSRCSNLSFNAQSICMAFESYKFAIPQGLVRGWLNQILLEATALVFQNRVWTNRPLGNTCARHKGFWSHQCCTLISKTKNDHFFVGWIAMRI